MASGKLLSLSPSPHLQYGKNNIALPYRALQGQPDHVSEVLGTFESAILVLWDNMTASCRQKRTSRRLAVLLTLVLLGGCDIAAPPPFWEPLEEEAQIQMYWQS